MTFLYIILSVAGSFCLCGMWFGLCVLCSSLLKKCGAAARFAPLAHPLPLPRRFILLPDLFRRSTDMLKFCLAAQRRFFLRRLPPQSPRAAAKGAVFLEKSFFGALRTALLWKFHSGCLCRERFLLCFHIAPCQTPPYGRFSATARFGALA